MYGNYTQLERYKSNKVIRVGGYVRCSGDEQKKNGYTIQDQTEYIDDFCQEHGLVMVERYVDEGISATLEISKRKDLARLIEDAKQGKFDIVVFKCIDRFFRNVGEYYICQRQLEKAGVTWLSIEESDLDPADPEAGFKINIYLSMAEYEARKTSKRIKFNNKNRIKNRQVISGNQNFLFPWHVVGEPKNKHLARNMEKAHILYDLLDYYEMHQSKVATVGYINRKYDMKITVKTVTKLISSTLLYGDYKGVPNYVEPYITLERYNKLQEIASRNIRQSYSPKHIFLFSSMVKCHECGHIMIGNANMVNGNMYFRYRCNYNRLHKICGNNKSLSEKKLEAQLLDNLEYYVANSIVKVSNTKDNTPDNIHEIEIREIKEEMDRLNIMFRKRRITEEEYDTDYFKLEKKLEKLEVPHEEPREIDVEHLKEILESNYREIYANLDKEHKRAFWHGLIKEFTVDENRQIIPDSIEFF